MDATPSQQINAERTARAKAQNAARVKRCRQRKVNGGCVITVDLSGDDINRLIKAASSPKVSAMIPVRSRLRYCVWLVSTFRPKMVKCEGIDRGEPSIG